MARQEGKKKNLYHLLYTSQKGLLMDLLDKENFKLDQMRDSFFYPRLSNRVPKPTQEDAYNLRKELKSKFEYFISTLNELELVKVFDEEQLSGLIAGVRSLINGYDKASAQASLTTCWNGLKENPKAPQYGQAFARLFVEKMAISALAVFGVSLFFLCSGVPSIVIAAGAGIALGIALIACLVLSACELGVTKWRLNKNLDGSKENNKGLKGSQQSVYIEKFLKDLIDYSTEGDKKGSVQVECTTWGNANPFDDARPPLLSS